MRKNSTTNSNNSQINNDGHTVVYHSGRRHINSSSITPTEEKKLSSSRDDVVNTSSSTQNFWERVFSWRSIIVIILHFSYIINMIPVVTMSMALVCMCGPIQAAKNNSLNHTVMSQIPVYTESTFLGNITLPEDKVYEFNWDSEMRGLLMSAYLFTVFIVPQLSNIIRHYIGNKLTLTFFSGTLAFLCFISPVAARTNVNLFLATRMLIGLCTNANVPISGDTLAWWTPVEEKLTSVTIVVTGWILGAGIGPLFAGYLCASGVDNGWPLIFYFNGILAAVWTIVWFLLSSRKPEDHYFISEKEKIYIITHRVGLNQVADRLPYRRILTSRPVIAFFVSSVCHLWSIIVIFICLPLYMTSVLKFSLQETGIIYSVMSGLRLPAALLWSAIGNWLFESKSMTTNSVRKISFGLGQSMAAVFCLGISFINEQHKWVACLLIIATVMNVTAGTTIASVVPLDMAPRYAGFITGINASLSCLVSITAPLTVSAITPQGSFEEWRVVWITLATVNLTSGMIFIVFGNASQQSWAVSQKKPPSNNADTEESSGEQTQPTVSEFFKSRSAEETNLHETHILLTQ